MIARLLVGCARVLFTLGALFLFAGGLAVYGAYRLLRAVTIGNRPAAKRDAAFAVVQSLVMLARTLKADGPASSSSTLAAIADELDDLDDTVLELFDDRTGAAA